MSKPPSWNEIRANAAKFAADWADETRERAEAQTFWNEFLAVFGVARRRVAVFEQQAERLSTGGRGAMDVFWPGVLVAEHKTAGRDLAAAERQAIDYLNGLPADQHPQVVITSDFGRMRILDLAGDNVAHEFPLGDLVKEIDRFGFIAGYTRRNFTPAQEEAANIEAARLMARLYEQLAAAGYEGHEASVLLTRMLFLLFGDDTGMWEKGLFSEFVTTRTSEDGTDLGAQLTHLFQVMDTKENRRPPQLDEVFTRFPYVNGGLFHDPLHIPAFDRAMRDEIVACCAFDWGAISPAIFGSMFQAVKSHEARRALGEHYTTEQNILKAIGPLFLDELRAKFDDSQNSVGSLTNLRIRLGALRIMDPACGCGNFLVVAYRELRDLELDIMRRLRDLTGRDQLELDATLGLKVSLDQFYGIEIEEWPKRIAEAAMFLTDHQANLLLAKEFGQAPDRLPIDISATIELGNALHTDWEDVLPASDDVIIVGNPPFIGQYTRTDEQVADLRLVWGNGYHGYLDYVTSWYVKAINYLGDHKARWAFVSTNSICQGEPVAPLWQPILDAGWRVRFAHRTFIWTSEAPSAAGVHAVIVGFDRETGRARLFDYQGSGRGDAIERTVTRINPYLVEGPDILVRSRNTTLATGLPDVTYGSKVADGARIKDEDKIVADDAKFLLVEEADYPTIAADPHASKYLREFIGARELVHGAQKWCLWMDKLDPADVRASAILRERIDNVRARRELSPDREILQAATTPHLFLRNLQPTTRYLAIPAHVGEARLYYPLGFYEPTVITGNHNFVASDPDGYLFGLLSSSMFMTWMRTVAGRIRADLRFSKTLAWNNFPLPAVTPAQRQTVVDAAKGVLAAREAHPGSSLADLYDPRAMPADLVAAHRVLDRAVGKCFGAKGALDTERERQKVLFDRYVEMTSDGQLPV